MPTPVLNRISVRLGGNYMENAFALPTAVHRDRVLQDTWGHLAPDRQKKYPGWILFTYTAWGVIELIDAQFEDLEDSPWLFNDLNDFVGELTDRDGVERRGIYRWSGTYLRFKNGNYRFSGKVHEVSLRQGKQVR